MVGYSSVKHLTKCYTEVDINPSDMNSPSSIKFSRITLLLLIVYTFLSGLGSYELLSKDEPRYSECAIEMIENQDFIVPKFNFQDRFDKPPLFYWLIAASYKFLGISAFSSRLPSAICAILLILFTWYTARKILGKTSGYLSAAILATSIEFIFLGRRAATDITLCLFFSSALYSLYLSYFIKEWKEKIFWVILSGIFSGFAVLTKGPVGIVFPLCILTLFLLLRKQFDVKHFKIYFLITFFAALISLPWYFAVHIKTYGEFTKAFFFTHNLERFTSVVGEHPGPVWFYIPVILIGFLPWTIFFIPALITFLKSSYRKSFNRFILFCLIWFFIIFLFFSTCKTKMATYIILLFPAIAIITGHWLSLVTKKKFNTIKNLILTLLLLIFISLPAGYIFISKSTLSSEDRTFFVSKLFILACFLFVGFFFILKYVRKQCSLITCFLISTIIPGIIMLNSALIVYHKITFGDLCNFAKTAKALGAKEIISFGEYKPILVYYSRLPVDFSKRPEQIEKIKKLLKEGKEVYLIGYLSDLKRKKPFIKNHPEIFTRLEIIDSGRKYFLGKIS